MKGVTFSKNQKNNRIILQIDVERVTKSQEDLEDLIDILEDEARRNEPKRSWSEVKKTLNKKATLK